MRPLADQGFDPTKPVQTKKGTAQALRCGHNKVDELIRNGVLDTVEIDRIRRITTASIFRVASGDVSRRRRKATTD